MRKKIKIMLIITIVMILAITTKANATTGKANQETIRIRKEATTNSGIVTLISLNEEVEILSEDGEWYKVKYKTYSGYIRKDMLNVENASQNVTENKTTENTSIENTNTATVESENNQNTENQVSNVEASNTENTTESAQNENTETPKEDNSQNNDEIKAGYTGKISSKIELKIIPTIISSNIHTIDENTQITVKDVMNKWSYIETESKSGWVLTNQIKIVEENKTEETTQENAKKEENKVEETQTDSKKEENTTKVEESKTVKEVTKYITAESLNVREKAENDAKIINQLTVNTKVTVTETTGNWSKIKVNGKTGYVASKYLSDKKVDVTSRSEQISRSSTETTAETATVATTSSNNSEKPKESSEKTESKTTSSQASSSSTSSSGATGSGIVEYAKKYLGYKYVSGGSSPETGFDCSGFTSYVYKHFGISISRTSGAQASNGTAVSKSNLQAGDLVIFNNKSNSSVGHVGIYIGGNTFIHAGSSRTGVITTSLSDSYYSKRYVTARRIIN